MLRMKILVQHVALLPATYIEMTSPSSSWLENLKVTHTLICDISRQKYARLLPLQSYTRLAYKLWVAILLEQVPLCGSPPTHISGLYIVWSSVLSKLSLILWL